MLDFSPAFIVVKEKRSRGRIPDHRNLKILTNKATKAWAPEDAGVSWFFLLSAFYVTHTGRMPSGKLVKRNGRK